MTRLLRVLLSALLTLTLLLSGSMEQVLYACGMDGQTRTSCCCPHADDSDRAGPSITSPDDCCCDVQTVSASPTLATDQFLAKKLELPIHTALAPSPGVVPPRSRVASRLIAPTGPRAPPDPHRPPVYIEVCSLLI